MLCTYLGVTIDYQRLVRLLEIRPNVGVSFSKIQNLEQLGLRVIVQKAGTLSQLYHLVAAGWPVIVSVQTQELPYWNGIDHYTQ